MKLSLELILHLALLAKGVVCGKRENVHVEGTTLGSNFVIPQGKGTQQTFPNLMIKNGFSKDSCVYR